MLSVVEAESETAGGEKVLATLEVQVEFDQDCDFVDS